MSFKVDKIISVFSSCNTEEQLLSALNWVNNLIDRDLSLYHKSVYIKGAYDSTKIRILQSWKKR